MHFKSLAVQMYKKIKIFNILIMVEEINSLRIEIPQSLNTKKMLLISVLINGFN